MVDMTQIHIIEADGTIRPVDTDLDLTRNSIVLDGVKYDAIGGVVGKGVKYDRCYRKALNQPKPKVGNCTRCHGTGSYGTHGVCWDCNGSGMKPRKR